MKTLARCYFTTALLLIVVGLAGWAFSDMKSDPFFFMGQAGLFMLLIAIVGGAIYALWSIK